MIEVKNLNSEVLLQLYGKLMEELRRRKLVRSSNNPVSDYAEKIVCEKLKLSLAGKSSKGYDAIDENTGIKYQIKARRLTSHNRSRQLGVIRNLDQNPFDYLIAVIFNESFEPIEIWQIPLGTIPKYARYSKHQNGHILVLTGDVLQDKTVSPISELTRSGTEGRETRDLIKEEKAVNKLLDLERRKYHRWTEEDDIVTLYLYRYGDREIPFTLEDISRILGMGIDSLRMRIANFKAIDGKGGLGHFGGQSLRIYRKYCDTSKDELKSLVVKILQESRVH
jgi:hypothetical protein